MDTNETRALDAQQKADQSRGITAKQPRRRRLLNGQTVPKATPGRTWNEFIAPALTRKAKNVS